MDQDSLSLILIIQDINLAITGPADVLAFNGDKPSGGMMLTENLDMVCHSVVVNRMTSFKMSDKIQRNLAAV